VSEVNSPVSVELKSGVPGLLATSGIALLAISVFTQSLFPVGITLLWLGILMFIGRSVVRFLGDIELAEASDGGKVLLGGYISLMTGVAIFVVWLFWPFLPIH